MNPVNRITIHHEGAGNPVDWARGGEGGYSIWIGDVNGDHQFVVLRSPWSSWGTLDFNHVSLDICFSGNRMVDPLTDADIDTLRAAVADARARGWVTDYPAVVDHHSSPGSNTVCSGNNVRARWQSVVLSCWAPNPTPPAPPLHKPVPPATHATLAQGSTNAPEVRELQLKLDLDIGAHLTVDGVFGPATNAAVKDLQRWFHLTVDGVCGPQTWALVDAIAAQKAAA